MPPRDEVRIIDITDKRAMDVLRNPVNGGVFEVMRRHRGGAGVADLASETGIPKGALLKIVDDLLEAGLATTIPARSGRPIRYATSCMQIAIRADPFNKAHSLAIRRHFRDATSDVTKALRDAEDFDGQILPGHHRLDARLKLELDASQWAEFRRRLRAAIDYAVGAADALARSRRRGTVGPQHAISIQLAPCRERLLPAPVIRMVNPATPQPQAAAGPRCGLSAREWQVAELFAGGTRRRDIATHLRVTPNTVATFLRRVYRKLGVSGRAELRLRLDRARRHG